MKREVCESLGGELPLRILLQTHCNIINTETYFTRYVKRIAFTWIFSDGDTTLSGLFQGICSLKAIGHQALFNVSRIEKGLCGD